MFKPKLLVALALCTSSLSVAPGCAASRRPFSTVDQALELDRVVLYRNGIGYFERRGEVDGDVLRIRVRKDQVDDLLKSLTVVDGDGKAVSVSMPLDAQSWASAALSVLGPGRGSLAAVLDAMRGNEVSLQVNGRNIRGRVVMVERTVNEPDPDASGSSPGAPQSDTRDFKVTLLSQQQMKVVRLSKVDGIKLHNGDLAMQFHRNLDAAAGEGMFQQIEVEIRLVGARKHDLMVSYVVEAPMWKPTYRVVLPEGGKGQALLQAWAVVDNLSGEDWGEVKLSLTSGAPIAFRYDLHSPRHVSRSDLSGAGSSKRAQVSLGETSYAPEPAPPPVMSEAMPEEEEMDYDFADDSLMDGAMGGAEKSGSRSTSKKAKRPASPPASMPGMGYGRGGGGYAAQDAKNMAEAEMGPALDYESLRRSTAANARAKQVTGLTQTDLTERVTVPDGTSTMVALVNAEVEAAETYLYKPGGAGNGYESNPYRVVRFKNTSEYVLEPGPISIYSGGSFVGEGLSETVGAGASVTIPFAVEPGIAVVTNRSSAGQKLVLTRLVRGVLEAESYYRTTTKYEVRTQPSVKTDEILVRHTRAGSNYTLAERPKGTEDLDGAYLIPIPIEPGRAMGSLEVIEETPSTITLTIWDGRAEALLEDLLQAGTLSSADRAKLQPVIDARRAIGRIDTEIDGLRRQQSELDRRAAETRQNLEAIKKDPRAGDLRNKLSKRLDEFTREADAIGRRIVELNSKRLEAKIALEDMLENLDFRVAKPSGKDGKVAK